VSAPSAFEQLILILAPTGRDAALACDVLHRAGLEAEPCPDVRVLCERLERGAGAVLVAEEALSPAAVDCLSEVLVRQPPWSDLPILIFAAAVDTRSSAARMQQMLDVLGNVTFVERPVRLATLVTAVRAALRARRRQYMARQTLLALAGQEEEARKRADFEQQLIGIVSHDLRNPLQAILMNAQALLRHDDLDERTSRAAIRINSTAERVVRMIRDLLDFTQARLGGGLLIRRTRMSLHELVRQVVEELQMTYPEREFLIRQEGDAQGEWDADRMAQVLTNLVVNALKYGGTGTPVTVTTRGDEDGVVLEVHNQGAPIPDSVRQRLFEPMHRGDPATDKAGRSVGLGLYIVKAVAEAHAGSVAVSSTAGEGTTFSLRLPRAPGRG
jgi:signal transduction histidine kinase